MEEQQKKLEANFRLFHIQKDEDQMSMETNSYWENAGLSMSLREWNVGA